MKRNAVSVPDRLPILGNRLYVKKRATRSAFVQLTPQNTGLCENFDGPDDVNRILCSQKWNDDRFHVLAEGHDNYLLERMVPTLIPLVRPI